jgi:hypothetical protein
MFRCCIAANGYDSLLGFLCRTHDERCFRIVVGDLSETLVGIIVHC